MAVAKPVSHSVAEDPAAYLTETVFNKRQENLAMVEDKKVVGGVSYRLFPECSLCELVFLGVKTVKQKQGYGTAVMDAFEKHLLDSGISYILTYADQQAKGFFGKRKFSQAAAKKMDRSAFNDLIKHYSGATLMGCFLEKKAMQQKRLSSKFDAVIDKSSPASFVVEDACKLETPTKRMKIDADTEVKNKIKSSPKVKNEVPAAVPDGKSDSSSARHNATLRRSLSTRPVGSKHAEDVALTSIKDMHRFCKAAMETNAKQLSSRMSVADFVKLCDKTSLSKDFDVEAIQNSFGQFFTWATSSKSIGGGTSQLPKGSASELRIHAFVPEKGIFVLQGKAIGELKKQYQDETDPLTIQCREEAKQKKLKHGEELKSFLEEFGHTLMNEQVEFVKQQIEKASKVSKVSGNSDVPKDVSSNYAYQLFCKEKGGKTKLSDEARKQFRDENDPLTIQCRRSLSKRSWKEIERYQMQIDKAEGQIKESAAKPSSKQKVKKLTAFEFYKLDKQEKYTNLDANHREEKLKRHFERLDAEKRAMYEEKEGSQ
uniref:N-acetyltransferase domain-containing protein n=1 Tax=Ditylenchus dipsaci TaxID=166011 RepID=A0A915DSS3_9BILA